MKCPCFYQDDTVFANAYEIERLPSEFLLRQRLDELPAERSHEHEALRALNTKLLGERTFGTLQAGSLELVPVDIDVSTLDNFGSHKQGVSFTYKKHDGYAPIFAYVGTEGYMLDHQLRLGSQHSQKKIPDFIGRCVAKLDTLNLSARALLRLDSVNNAVENFAHFGENYFIAKRNLRKECPEQWLAIARRVGQLQSTRESKNVHTGFVDYLCPGGKDFGLPPVTVAFEVIERLTDPDGNYLLQAEIEVNTSTKMSPIMARNPNRTRNHWQNDYQNLMERRGVDGQLIPMDSGKKFKMT